MSILNKIQEIEEVLQNTPFKEEICMRALLRTLIYLDATLIVADMSFILEDHYYVVKDSYDNNGGIIHKNTLKSKMLCEPHPYTIMVDAIKTKAAFDSIKR